MDRPRDPVAAATHPDPYPYYRELITRRPLYHDDTLGLWERDTADDDCIHEREDGAVGGDAERERDHGYDRHPTALDEQARCEADVLEDAHGLNREWDARRNR